MFGLSWGQLAIIILVGVFVLGPERLPTAVTWSLGALRKARMLAAGAQADLGRELGPEIAELRQQIAELNSLREIKELRELSELHPRRLFGTDPLGFGPTAQPFYTELADQAAHLAGADPSTRPLFDVEAT